MLKKLKKNSWGKKRKNLIIKNYKFKLYEIILSFIKIF